MDSKEKLLHTRIKYLEMGITISSVPFGYKRMKGKVTLIPKMVPYVKEAFSLCSKGESVASVEKKLSAKYGFYMGRSSLYRLIKNPFYYGYISYNGNLYKHIYETIIDKEMFLACNSHTPSVNYKKGRDYIFKGLIECGINDCHKFLTSETVGNNVYYKCQGMRVVHRMSHESNRISELQIINHLASYFNEMVIISFDDDLNDTLYDKIQYVRNNAYKMILTKDIVLIRALLSLILVKLVVVDKKITHYIVEPFLSYTLGLQGIEGLGCDLKILNKVCELTSVDKNSSIDKILLNLLRIPHDIDEIIQKVDINKEKLEEILFTLQVDGKIEEEFGLYSLV